MKPSRIEDYHSKMGRIMDILHCSGDITDYSKAIAERKQKEGHEKEYSNGKYSIIMPKDAMEIIAEGRALDHCVGQAGYIEKMAAGMTCILFVRKNKLLRKPLITLELMNGDIRQCYGFRDSYNTDPEIRDFIKEFAAHMGLTISAVIFSESSN